MMTQTELNVLKRVAKLLNTADSELAIEFQDVLESAEPRAVADTLFELLQTEV